MQEILFKIDNLVCSYSGNTEEKVLSIENLEIERNQLVFLLGASGSGKSTLLETLGLMNNTIARGEVTLKSATDEYNFSEIWKKKNESVLSEIRKKHLSFIFQNTNLMENFTAYENICLAKMIKQDISQQDVITSAKEYMARVNLSEKDVNETTLAYNLSGGQRQRLAFVRAVSSTSTVL